MCKEENWNFQREMLEYCKSDVQLLREGCLKFAQDTMQEANFEVFEETSLPPKEALRNDLTVEDISEEKYQFAQRVWKTMGCQTMGETLQIGSKEHFKGSSNTGETWHIPLSISCVKSLFL